MVRYILVKIRVLESIFKQTEKTSGINKPSPSLANFKTEHTYRVSTGRRSTFEFPSRVSLSGPSLYCIAQTLVKWSRHSIGLAGATRLTRSDFRLHLLLLMGQKCVEWLKDRLSLVLYNIYSLSHTSLNHLFGKINSQIFFFKCFKTWI